MRVYGIAAEGAAAGFFERPDPGPGPGEIGVRIAACGLNFADLLMIEGRYQDRPAPPLTLGMELAGTVTAAGPGSGGFRPGDRVAVFAGSGGLAPLGAFPADRAVRLPEAMPFETAAAFQVAYGTSHLALTRRARLMAGETLLVLGAAGGVGLTAVEIGRQLGARVIAVARGAERLAVARAAGAHHLIEGDTADLAAEVKALGGADVIYDPVGGAALSQALRAARPEARVLVIGFASGTVPELRANHLLVKNIDVIGFYWGGYLRFAPAALRESLGALIGWWSEGRIRPHVGHLLPFAETGAALDLLRGRAATGKVVVRIGDG